MIPLGRADSVRKLSCGCRRGRKPTPSIRFTSGLSPLQKLQPVGLDLADDSFGSKGPSRSEVGDDGREVCRAGRPPSVCRERTVGLQQDAVDGERVDHPARLRRLAHGGVYRKPESDCQGVVHQVCGTCLPVQDRSGGTALREPPPHRRRRASPHFTITITTQRQTVEFLVLQEQDRTEHVATEKELAEAKKNSWIRIPRFDYTPSERLPFVLSGGQPHRASEWSDTPGRSLEDQLVTWFGDPVAVTSDAVEDLVGGPGPLEGPGLVVPGFDPLFECGLEVVE